MFRGGAGDDEIYGGGGDDLILWSGGTDILEGGTGFDTLGLDGVSASFDLGANLSNLTDFEAIDLEGSTADTLVIVDASSVEPLSSTTDELVVTGDAGDVVDLGPGWTIMASSFDLYGDGRLFDAYDFGPVRVWTETDITVV